MTEIQRQHEIEQLEAKIASARLELEVAVAQIEDQKERMAARLALAQDAHRLTELAQHAHYPRTRFALIMSGIMLTIIVPIALTLLLK